MAYRLHIFLLVFLSYCSVKLVAQANFDCATSTISACNGNPSFPFVMGTGPNTWGNVQDLPGNSTSSVSNPAINPASSNSGCLLSGELHPTWVQVNISSSGTLQFTFNQPGSYVDWAMWPYNSTACADIQNNTLAPVRCNYNASPTGGTGIGPVPAGGNPGNFEPTLNVTAGQSFIICVSNYSNINGTVNMTFNGTAGTSCVPFSSSNSQTVCPGASATLSLTTSLAGPSYTWTPGNSNSSSITVSPSVTTVYTINVTGTNTVTNTYTTQVLTSTVTIATLPTVSISNGGPYCQGATGMITASTNGVASYTWAGPGAYSNTTTTGSISFPNIQPSSAGVYSVTVQNTYSCTNTGTTNLVVIPTNTIAVTSSVTTCQNSSFSLTANATGAIAYNWTGPLGYTAQNTQSPVITNAQPNQSGTYTVTAIFGAGTATCQTRNTVTVTVIPLLTISLTPMPTICYNGDINLTGPNGATSYTWTGPGGFSSNQQSPVINNAGSSNQGVYSLQATTNSCVNSGSLSINVYAPLSISGMSTSTVICNKRSTSLSASGTGGSGSYNYNWSPVLSLGSPNAATTVASPNATQDYTFTLSDANCTITPTPTAAVTVSVNALPVITFTTPNNEGCEPFSTVINAQSTPTSVNCVWKFTNNLMATGCNLSGMLFPVHGTYNAMLTVTDVNGCIDSLTQNAFIKVDPKPVPDFDMFPQSPTILTNEVTFTDKSTVGAPMQRWHWSFNDQYTTADKDTSALKNPVHVFEQSGTYTISLKVINQFGCMDSITKPLIVEDEFALYIPNAFTPSRQDGVNDNFTVKGIGFLASSFEMLIFDRWGEQIYRTNDINKGWDGTVKGGGKAKQDVYVYKITVTNLKLKDKIFTGHITLL